jgi:hypothetical protein
VDGRAAIASAVPRFTAPQNWDCEAFSRFFLKTHAFDLCFNVVKCLANQPQECKNLRLYWCRGRRYPSSRHWIVKNGSPIRVHAARPPSSNAWRRSSMGFCLNSTSHPTGFCCSYNRCKTYRTRLNFAFDSTCHLKCRSFEEGALDHDESWEYADKMKKLRMDVPQSETAKCPYQHSRCRQFR